MVDQQLVYRAVNPDGTSWGAPTQVFDFESAGGSAGDVLDIGGRPGIAFSTMTFYRNAFFGVLY